MSEQLAPEAHPQTHAAGGWLVWIGASVVTAIFLWVGTILSYVDSLPHRAFPLSMTAAAVMTVIAVIFILFYLHQRDVANDHAAIVQQIDDVASLVRGLQWQTYAATEASIGRVLNMPQRGSDRSRT